MRLVDESGCERDFFFEMQKHAFHLRQQFTARQLAVYELYKQTIEVPGCVAEIGVRNGANFFYLARLMEIFNPAQRFDGISARRLYGFDTFAGFPAIDARDESKASWSDMKTGGVGANRETFFADLDAYRKDSPIAARVHVVEGDVCETIPALIEDAPGLRFALLYFDLDLYQPTLSCLRVLWDKVPRGGIVAFDEFGLAEFPGESQAVDEFIADKGCRLRSFSWCHCPSAYLIKDC